MKFYFRSLLTLVLLIAQFGYTAQDLSAQTANCQVTSDNDNLSVRLAAIEKAVDERRVALGIPGISLAIVKDDKIIFSKGFGLRDIDKKLPVTPDTLFAVGSSTKAFTSMAMMMSADAGKLSLDDNPKKFLPYFKLNDPDSDARVTLRDLLSHRTGLARTDLALSFANGKLTREELIQVAGIAKPTAKLGQRFQYQNVMYTAAGEIAGKANSTTYEKFVAERIFKPLGMNRTNLSIAELKASPDFSLGYDFNPETKETKLLNAVDVSIIAPAGAINSNARDMSKWLRFLLAGGVYKGKRLVSEKNFSELWKPQITMSPEVSYGFAWFLRDWHGKKEVDHGGNIDGYNAMVAMIPEEHLGLVMLSNVSASPLSEEIREIVYSNLLNSPAANLESETSADPSQEVGKYLLAEAGIVFEVLLKDGKLIVRTLGQPEYTLENIGGRRYIIAGTDNYFATFRPVKGKENETEVLIEQPEGKAVLSRIKPAAVSDTNSAEASATLKEIIGSYESERSGLPIEIANNNGAVTMTLQGQPPRRLTEKSKDSFAVEGTPANFVLLVKRDADGKTSGLLYDQGGIVAPLRRVTAPTNAPTIEELNKKIIEAAGGESNLRKHTSVQIKSVADYVNQGVTVETVSGLKAPNKSFSKAVFMTLGKAIGTSADYFDGERGDTISSNGTPLTYSGKVLGDARIASDIYELLDWKTLYKTVKLKKITKIGEEDVYVIEKVPEKGNPITEFISTKSYLVLRRNSSQYLGYGDYFAPKTETFSDYRLVDGVMMPFKIVSSDSDGGSVVTAIKAIDFNVELPDSMFNPPAR